jgi:hypothetical protein
MQIDEYCQVEASCPLYRLDQIRILNQTETPRHQLLVAVFSTHTHLTRDVWLSVLNIDGPVSNWYPHRIEAGIPDIHKVVKCEE